MFENKRIALLALFCVPLYFSATGSISGTLYDKNSGDTLIGAIIRLNEQNKSAVSDLNGNFSLRGLDAGSYSLTVVLDGYAETRVENAKINDGNLELNIEMVPTGMEERMTVSVDAKSDSEIGLLKSRQNANTISDAISFQEIARTGGSTAADAVSKVTGASVVGGKYVYIRGLGDRYTSTHLNGVELPTSDPDVKAFQADMFPASVLDNIVTLKAFTPDKPGNFSGGIIDIATKTFPAQLLLDFSLSSSYNSVAANDENFLTYAGGGRDWLGVDDGTRALPSSLAQAGSAIPTLQQARRDETAANLLNQLSHSFNPAMSPTSDSSPLNRGFSLSAGNQFSLGGRTLGILASLNYNRNYSARENLRTSRWKLTQSAAAASSLAQQSSFTGNRGEDKVTWGGILTMNYSLATSHSLSFNLLHNQSGESTASYYSGSWQEQFGDEDAVLESRVLKYSERLLDSYQLRGNHYFEGLGSMIVEWIASYANTEQDEPDTRIFTDHYADIPVNGQIQRVYSITASTYSNPARYFRNLEEEGKTFQLDLSWPLRVFGRDGLLKIGTNYDKKERDFHELRYEYVTESNVRYTGDPEQYFGADNVGILGYDPVRNRYQFGAVIQFAQDVRGGDYQGSFEVQAQYLQLELGLTDHLRLVSGVRNEKAKMQVYNATTSGSLDNDDWLPALHLIQKLSDRANLRFSYGRTLARPNFREKAPYSSYDFLADGIFAGNPELKRTLINNFDLRWELFQPGGQLIAASLFYKDMTDPIERAYNIRFSSEFGERTFTNVPSATVQGLELEMRRSLSEQLFGGQGSHALSISANLSLIHSSVDIPAEELAFTRLFDPEALATRDLQGQSPYLANFGINYDQLAWNGSFSLFYNVFGERLYEVGLGAAPAANEQKRQQVDFTYAQTLGRNLRLRFSAKNLLDEATEISQSFKGTSYIQSSYNSGITYGLSLGFRR